MASLILALLLGSAPVGGNPVLLTFGLVTAGAGHQMSAGPSAMPLVPFEAGEVAVGARFGPRVGVAVGTTVVYLRLLEQVSFLPLQADVCYDLSPAGRWRRQFLYLKASYVRDASMGWDQPTTRSFLRVGLGAAYTFYFVTPRVELSYDTYYRSLGLWAGLTIGGTYVLRK